MALIVTIPAVSSTAANFLRSNNPGTADGRTVYVPPFWPNTTDLKSFFLEYYAKVIDDGWGNGPCYFLSAGFGGAHAILFGMQKDPTSGLYHPIGNIRRFNTGSSAYDANNISSDAAFGTVAGEWAHWACAFDASTCLTYVYLNGICTGVITFGTPGTHIRQIQVSDVSTDIYIAGGSNHSMLSMGLAQMRLCDGHVAGGQLYTPGTPEAPFVPDRCMGPLVGGANTGGNVADLLFDFTVGTGRVLPDLSRAGRQGDNLRRSALLTNTLAQGFGGCPVWDYDANMPCRLDSGVGPFGERTRTPTSPPVGAVVYDSFERANATFLNGNTSATNPQLGSVEVGIAGSKTWSYGVFPGQTNTAAMLWGILCGYAVPQVNCPHSWSAVETNIVNHQVLADAYNSAFARKRCGLVARFVDANNFYYVIQANSDASQLFLGKVVAGVETVLNAGAPFNASPSTSWTTISLNCNGTTLTVKTDNNTVLAVTDSSLQTGTKAGLCKYDFPAPTVSSTWRAKNFTVKAAF